MRGRPGTGRGSPSAVIDVLLSSGPMKVVIVVDILVFVPFVLAVGWLTSRLLGVHLGFWRGVVAATIGWGIGAVAAALVTNDQTPAEVVIPLILFFGVLATMPISIVLELITRRTKPRRRLRRWLFHPIREIKAIFAPYGRLREVLHYARKQNLMHVRYASSAALESPEFARRLRTVLEESGGMFVKFGQIASTRSDMLPPTLTDELSLLRSDVRPIPGTKWWTCSSPSSASRSSRRSRRSSSSRSRRRRSARPTEPCSTTAPGSW